MKRYVDADLAFLYMDNSACEQIERMPVADDVQKVRHGHWLTPETKYPYYNWKCSYCGCEDYTQTDRNGKYKQMNYCPNCGAKMEETK